MKLKLSTKGPSNDNNASLEDTITCDKCKFITRNLDDLRTHIVKDHTVNLFQGLSFQESKDTEEIGQEQGLKTIENNYSNEDDD